MDGLKGRNKKSMKRITNELILARRIWGKLGPRLQTQLTELVSQHRFSIASGHVQKVDGNWYVAHAGLLYLAKRSRCTGIRVEPCEAFCDAALRRWVFKATVYKSKCLKGFVGFGDADPSNVPPQFRGSELRIAESRATSRALRKAYGIGLCSVEELGWTPKEAEPPAPKPAPSAANGNGNGAQAPSSPRLRDRLCLLIRQHRLDPSLVKSYATDFCGTPSLHLADRERLEAFVSTLSQRAATDRDALICHLNSYSRAKEVHP